MRIIGVAATLTLFLCAAGVSAQYAYEFTVAPVAGMRFGDTRFQIDFEFVVEDTIRLSGGSELVFPIDVTQSGAQFGFKVMKGTNRVWTADLRLLLAVSDPGSKMTDKDWYDTEFGKVNWSSTESTVDGSVAELELEITRTLVATKTFELAALLAGSYQKVKQRMIDLSGSQMGVDELGNIVVYQFEDDDLAGTYEIRFIRPQVGLAPRFLMGPVMMEFKGVVSPLLHAKDIDDHVRRYFQIRTDGKGFGYGGRAAILYQSTARGNLRPYACLKGELSKAEIDVSGYREYYADNPDEDARRGDRYAEDHTVSSTQYGIHLALGLTF